jgi:hypothetical protein
MLPQRVFVCTKKSRHLLFLEVSKKPIDPIGHILTGILRTKLPWKPLPMDPNLLPAVPAWREILTFELCCNIWASLLEKLLSCLETMNQWSTARLHHMPNYINDSHTVIATTAAISFGAKSRAMLVSVRGLDCSPCSGGYC